MVEQTSIGMPSAPYIIIRAKLHSLSIGLRGTEREEAAAKLTGDGGLMLLEGGTDLLNSWRRVQITIAQRIGEGYGNMLLGPLLEVGGNHSDVVSLQLRPREFDLLIATRLGACRLDLELRLMGAIKGEPDDIFGAQYEVLRYSVDLREPSHAA